MCFLVLCAALPYANTLFNGFVHDDTTQVLENPYVRSFRYLPKIFTTSVWSFKGSVSNYYRPMMTLEYLTCYKIFGFAPYGFHLANVALHLAVVVLLFFLTMRMFEDRMLAFVAAAAFALHPIHAEAVAWIAAVTDLELTFFYLLTFLLFLEAARPGGGRSELAYLAMAASYVLALLSKEQAVTLPFLATVYEHFYRDDRTETTRAQKFSRYRVLWLLAVAYVPLRAHFLGAFAPEAKFPNLTTYPTFLSVIALVGQYLWKLLWPVRLKAYYVFHPSAGLLEPRVLAGIGGFALCAMLFLALWKRARTASFGLLWLFTTLSPVLNPHWVGLNVFTERYLYLPSVGFCWVLGWGIQRLWVMASTRRPLHRSALAAGLSILTVLAAFRIVIRNRDWQDNLVFYLRVLEASPDADLVRTNLGTVYWKQGNLKEAEREWRRLLACDPDNLECLNNLGAALIDQRRYAEAVELFQRAIQLNPKYADSHLNLGLVYLRMGVLDPAEVQMRAGVALAPQNSTGYANLGILYWRKADRVRAESAFRRALALSPHDSSVHYSLGEFYATNGRAAEAIREYQAALEDDPDNAEALSGLLKLESQTPNSKPSRP